MLQRIKAISSGNRTTLSNISYMGAMQIANYVFPFITIPYLVKTLSKESFGVYSLALIIMSYIGIIVDYGFNLTATREIAVHKDNKTAIHQLTSSVFYIKAFFLLILFITGLLLAIIHIVPWLIVFAVLIYGIGQALFPVWFLQGVENMRSITIFNTCAKLVSTISIFLFVKNARDAQPAMFLYASGVFVAGISSFVYVVNKYKLQFVSIHMTSLKRMVADGFDIFLTSLFSNVVINGGALILGFFGGTAVVGIYSAIEKIARAIIGVLSAVTQVIFPGIARTLAENKQEGIRRIKKIGSLFILVLSIGCTSLMFFSKPLLNLLYGSFYNDYAYMLCILLVWVIFSFINNFIGIQFLVAGGNNKYYRKAFLLTTIYILLSFAGIKLFLLDGLVFSMLSGEIFLMLSMIYFIRKNNLTAG